MDLLINIDSNFRQESISHIYKIEKKHNRKFKVRIIESSLPLCYLFYRDKGVMHIFRQIWANIQKYDKPAQMYFKVTNKAHWTPIFNGGFTDPKLGSIQVSKKLKNQGSSVLVVTVFHH